MLTRMLTRMLTGILNRILTLMLTRMLTRTTTRMLARTLTRMPARGLHRDEDFDDRGVAAGGGPVEGGLAVVVGLVDLRATVKTAVKTAV